MINFIIDKPSGNPELVPIYAGFENCKPNHRFGPYIRDSFLIHFCISGCGILKDKYGEHKISSGEMFVIRPGESTVYEADAESPWSYVWIGFGGERAETLLNAPSVMKTAKDPFLKITASVKNGISSSDIYISALYEIFHHIFSGEEANGGIAAVKRYINYNYMNSLTVSDIAKHFGLDRSYLYRIFKAKYGIGLKGYLTEVRMSHAREFLFADYTVGECAAMCGYSDPFSFSRAYKNHFGTAPAANIKKE